MKSLTLFSRLFIALSLWTVAFLSLAGYASEKVYRSDPKIINKFAEKHNFNFNVNGFLLKNITGPSGAREETSDSWTFAVPEKKITIKSVAGNFSIKKSFGKEVLISASGMLDKSKAARLLEIEFTGDELNIRQPDNEASEVLDVHIEIPESFTQELEAFSVSGDISLENLQLQSLDLKTVSGDLTLHQLSTENLNMKSVSGDLDAENSSLSKVSGKSVSGDISISNEIPMNLSLTTVSGDVKLKLTQTENTQFLLNSVSGEIQNSFESTVKADHQVNVSTMSGDISLE